MTDDLYWDISTDVHNAPALCIPHIDGLTLPANKDPDGSVTTGHVMYMHLTSFNGPDSEQVSTQALLPLITQDGQTWGGQIPYRPPIVRPKVTMEGYIDTPSQKVGEYFLPLPHDSDGALYSYAEILVMMIEGRANQQSGGAWGRLDPLWFRDPYGRVYNNPRILVFTGQLVSGVPERTQITMTLKVR